MKVLRARWKSISFFAFSKKESHLFGSTNILLEFNMFYNFNSFSLLKSEEVALSGQITLLS